MIKTFNYLFVTCFGIGSFRYAPGTITSLITTVFLFSLFHIINLSSNIILITLLLIFIYSFYAVSNYLRDNDNKDPKEVVVDEFIGQSIPIYLYEVSHGTIKDPQEAVENILSKSSSEDLVAIIGTHLWGPIISQKFNYLF